MSKRKRKNNRKPPLSGKVKFRNNCIFGILFAVLLLLIMGFLPVFLLVHKPFGFAYIVPTMASLLIGCAALGLCVAILIALYKSVMYDRVSIKNYIKIHKKSCTVLLCLLLLAGIYSYSSFYYIDENGYNSRVLTKNEQIFSTDVEKIEIKASKVHHSSKYSFAYSYIVACDFKTENGEYTIESSGFYDYADMYDYLLQFGGKISVDKTELDELLAYQNKRPLISKEKQEHNKEYIDKILCWANKM